MYTPASRSQVDVFVEVIAPLEEANLVLKIIKKNLLKTRAKSVEGYYCPKMGVWKTIQLGKRIYTPAQARMLRDLSKFLKLYNLFPIWIVFHTPIFGQ